ncbi:MAG: PVC-type heme-binding CxxCH protein, partial [Planctomycetota bacterium]
RFAFLSFNDALQRLTQHLLANQPIRDDNGDTGVRLVDLNNDGFMDVVIPTQEGIRLRVWNDIQKSWQTTLHECRCDSIKFGTVQDKLQLFTVTKDKLRQFEWTGGRLVEKAVTFFKAPAFIYTNDIPVSGKYQLDFRDLNGNGTTELLIASANGTDVMKLAERNRDISSAFLNAYSLPTTSIGDSIDQRHSSVRFRDINGDKRLDLIFSDGQTYAVHLFESDKTGWGNAVLSGKFGDTNSIPPFVRPDGTNNGVWFHSNSLWVQNEQTNRLPNLVDRYAFEKMVAGGREDESSNEDIPASKSPTDALNSFSQRKGVRFELVAAEPLIEDPVAFDWGPDGSLWVVEMRDYPNGLTWNKQGDPLGEPGGRVKRLIDSDGDGKFDQSQLFIDKLPFPTAIKVWRNGVIVASAPHLWYVEDTNGDGKADLRKIMYEGFTEGNQQHRVNGLRWGIDQWLYLANGDSGGVVRSLKTDQSVRISGRDLRIKPDEGLIQTQTGMTQSGRNRDDDGNWFGGDNSNPIRHYALDETYLKRNPNFAPPSPRRAVSEVPGAAPIFPASRTLTRFNDYDRANRYTSACSPMVFREQCGSETDKFVYVCEPVHNLVGREVLSAQGLTFRSRRADQEQSSELIASSDNWFRPVMIRTGPDGALWIADMYRLVIEHPEWIPKAWQDKLDLRGGSDKGRIYRVVFDDVENAFAASDWRKLQHATTDQLVEHLDCSNGTVRDIVHQLLLWRNDRNASRGLTRLLEEAKWKSTQSHVLYLLDTFDNLDNEQLAKAIRTPNSTLCRHAMRIAETRLAQQAKGDSKVLVDAILHVAKTRPTTSTGLRNVQQAAYSLGYVRDDRAPTALAAIAHDYASDPLMVAAVFSSVREDNVSRLVSELIRQNSNSSLLHESLKQAIALEQTQCLDLAIAHTANKKETARFDFISNMTSIARRKGLDLSRILSKPSQDVVDSIADVARVTANDKQATDANRIQAIRLLGESEKHIATDRSTLTNLLEPQFSPQLQKRCA